MIYFFSAAPQLVKHAVEHGDGVFVFDEKGEEGFGLPDNNLVGE